METFLIILFVIMFILMWHLVGLMILNLTKIADTDVPTPRFLQDMYHSTKFEAILLHLCCWIAVPLIMAYLMISRYIFHLNKKE